MQSHDLSVFGTSVTSTCVCLIALVGNQYVAAIVTYVPELLTQAKSHLIGVASSQLLMSNRLQLS